MGNLLNKTSPDYLSPTNHPQIPIILNDNSRLVHISSFCIILKYDPLMFLPGFMIQVFTAGSVRGRFEPWTNRAIIYAYLFTGFKYRPALEVEYGLHNSDVLLKVCSKHSKRSFYKCIVPLWRSHPLGSIPVLQHWATEEIIRVFWTPSNSKIFFHVNTHCTSVPRCRFKLTIN